MDETCPLCTGGRGGGGAVRGDLGVGRGGVLEWALGEEQEELHLAVQALLLLPTPVHDPERLEPRDRGRERGALGELRLELEEVDRVAHHLLDASRLRPEEAVVLDVGDGVLNGGVEVLGPALEARHAQHLPARAGACNQSRTSTQAAACSAGSVGQRRRNRAARAVSEWDGRSAAGAARNWAGNGQGRPPAPRGGHSAACPACACVGTPSLRRGTP